MSGMLSGPDPVDYGRLMGTVVTEMKALVAVQREIHNDLVAALGAVTQHSGSAVVSRRARTGLRVLASGADANAGQTTSSSTPSSGPGMLRLVDPSAGRLSGPTPHTVEDARGIAFGAQMSRVWGAISGFPPVGTRGSRGLHFLAGTTARAGTGGQGAGTGGAGGGTPQQMPPGGTIPYVPGYGYYGGQGTPYTSIHGTTGGAGAAGGGYGHGGIPPSGSGGGGGSSHLGLLGTIGGQVPVVGLGVRGVEEALSQREKNSFYQNVEGGSNAAGFGERLKEETYRWSSLGVFSSAEARQAFKGVTKIGYNGKVEQGHGPGRQQALNFIYHGKDAYGATVDESLATLQKASENALTPLGDLSKALKDLSDDAGKAGVNAQMARSQMMGLFSQALSSGYGSGATAAASTISDTMASYGRSYADSSAAGQLTPQYGRYAAAQAGMTYGQLVSLQKTNPQAAANVRTGVGLQAINQVLTPAQQAWMRQQIVAYGGKVDESTSLRIASDFMRQFGKQVDPGVVNGQLSALTGISFSDYDHALGWAALQMAGNTESARAGTTMPSDLTGTGTVSAAQAWQWGLGGAQVNSVAFGGKSMQQAISPSKGQIDPVMALLQQKVKDPSQQYVTVHTASGPQVMRLDQAMASHRNEIAAGQVQFVGTQRMVRDPRTGKSSLQWAKDSYSGQTVSQVLGGRVDTSRSWKDEAAGAEAKGIPISQVPLASQLANQTAANASVAGASQMVTVDLSADARKLLTVMGQSGVTGAAGEAAPPLNPFAANPSLNR